MTVPARRAVAFELTWRSIFRVVAVILGLWVLYRVRLAVLMLVLALVIVGTLHPLVASLERRGLGRGWAIAAVFTSVLGSAGLLLGLTLTPLIAQLVDLVGDAPALMAELATRLEGIQGLESLAELVREADLGDLIASVSQTALSYSTQIVYVVGVGVTIVFLAIYLISDQERALALTYALLPRRMHQRGAHILVKAEVIVGGFLRGQIITSLLIGLFTFGLLSIVGTRNAIALAGLAAIADVLPFIGGLLATLPAVLATLPLGTGPTLAVLIAMTLYQELENRVLVPRVYGHVLRLPAAVVILSVVIGGSLYGIVGAFLALPIAAGLRMVVEELKVILPGDERNDSEP